MLGVFQITPTEFFAIFILAVLVVGIIGILVGVLWMYPDARSRGMDGTLWVVLLIIASFLGGLIGLVIAVVAYLIARGKHPVGGGMPYAYWPYPPASPQTPCPVCGRPMTWYPQYGRWYCFSCAQYR